MCIDPTQQYGNSNFTDADVLAVASQLLESNGETTTLDAKNLLRDGGFKAFQADVSLAMDRLANQEDWHWNFNGTFRIFYTDVDDADDNIDKDEDDDVSAIVGAMIVIKSTPTPLLSSVKRVPDPVPVIYTARPEDGDWQVFDYQSRKPVVYIKQGVTRNAARNWYSTMYGIEYTEVAASLYNAS